MVDRYDPMPVGYDRCTMVEDKHGDYVLYSDHAALCEAVREWDRLEKQWVSACDSRCPEEADDYGARVMAARRHMLALANQ